MSSKIYDYVVIGAGMYGLRMAKIISKKHSLAKILVLDSLPLSQSINLSKNYYSVDTGVNCKVDSEMYESITEGSMRLKEFLNQNFLFNETIGEIIATNEQLDKLRLNKFLNENDQDKVKIDKISNIAAREMDKSININNEKLEDFSFYHIPNSYIVDFNQIKTFLYEDVLKSENIEICFDSEVTKVQFRKEDSIVEINTKAHDKDKNSNRTDFKGKFLINTSGVNGLDIAHMCNSFMTHLSYTYREYYFYLNGKPIPRKIISSIPELFHSGVKLVPVSINDEEKTIFGPKLKFVSLDKSFWKKLKLYYKFFKATLILHNLNHDSRNDQKYVSLWRCVNFFKVFYNGFTFPKDYQGIDYKFVEKNILFSHDLRRFEMDILIEKNEYSLHIMNYTMRGGLASLLPITEKALELI